MIRFSYLLFITIHALKLGCDFKILILWYHHTFPAFLILNARNIGIVTKGALVGGEYHAGSCEVKEVYSAP